MRDAANRMHDQRVVRENLDKASAVLEESTRRNQEAFDRAKVALGDLRAKSDQVSRAHSPMLCI